MSIRHGDLVMVIRPRECCGWDGSLGAINTVISRKPVPTTECNICGDISKNGRDIVILDDGSSCSKRRLKKIDPPPEGETPEAYKKMGQPA